MGKQNFKDLYRRIKSELGEVTCKVSAYSDKFDPNKNYAGMIVYAIDGKFKWRNTGGKARGYNGRSFYIIIQCTNSWPLEAYGRAGQGLVHDYLIRNTIGREHSEKNLQGEQKICCGGFAYRDGTLRFSSIWLNQSDQQGCKSDGSKFLSDDEKMLVEYCFEQYKRYGANYTFNLPVDIDRRLLGYQSSDRRQYYSPLPPPPSYSSLTNVQQVANSGQAIELSNLRENRRQNQQQYQAQQEVAEDCCCRIM